MKAEEIQKIEKFKNWMIRELEVNEKNKGFITDFINFEKIITELEYHKAKLLIAIRCDNKHAVKEYIADTANFLFCLGNLGGVYDDDFIDISPNESIEIIKDHSIFIKTTTPTLNQIINYKK